MGVWVCVCCVRYVCGHRGERPVAEHLIFALLLARSTDGTTIDAVPEVEQL